MLPRYDQLIHLVYDVDPGVSSELHVRVVAVQARKKVVSGPAYEHVVIEGADDLVVARVAVKKRADPAVVRFGEESLAVVVDDIVASAGVGDDDIVHVQNVR